LPGIGFKGRSVGGESSLEEDWSLEGDEEDFEDIVRGFGTEEFVGFG